MTTDEALQDVAVSDPPGSPALAALAVVDELTRLVEPLADHLRDVIPGLVMRRGFSAGGWVIGLHVGGLPTASPLEASAGHKKAGAAKADPTTPGLRQPFSRLDLRIQRVDGGEELDVEARQTVRDRRTLLESLRCRVGSPELAAFLQSQALSFADRYFDRI